jgi:hypothetical protein
MNQRNEIVYIQSVSNDVSTHEVMSFLFFIYSGKILRHGDEELFEIDNIRVDSNQTVLNSEGRFQNFSIISYWYRRGKLNLGKNHVELFEIFQEREFKLLSSTFEELISDKNSINKFSDNFLNKLVVLKFAKMLNIKIPPTKFQRNSIPFGSPLLVL